MKRHRKRSRFGAATLFHRDEGDAVPPVHAVATVALCFEPCLVRCVIGDQFAEQLLQRALLLG